MATAADITQPWLSGQNHIDSLLWQFIHWDYHTPSDSALYYTFSVDNWLGVTAFTPEEQAAARLAIGDAASATGIRFVEVASGNAADLHFAMGDIGAGAAGVVSAFVSYTVAPDQIVHDYTADAYIQIAEDMFVDLDPGTAAYQVLLHEIGHALALKHPHDGNITLSAAEDNTGNTVMSYNWVGSPKSDYQSFDLAALNWWYGGDGLGGLAYGGTRAISLMGTAGADTVAGGAGSDTLDGGSGNDSLTGGAGHDVLIGGAGTDLLDGGLGSDVYFVTSGDQLVDSGGTDTIVVDMTWTLAAGFENVVLTGSAALLATGNASANDLWGNAGANRLAGLANSDELFGGDGDDTIIGGTNTDFLSGGTGVDVFLFAESSSNDIDWLLDFQSGVDKIHLDANVFTQLGAAGAFAAGDPRFHAAPNARGGADPNDRVIYDTVNDELLYDADGSGPVAAVRVAINGMSTSTPAALEATDIVVVAAAGSPGQVGTPGNDSLVGSAGNDTLEGLAGNDTLQGLAGNDSLDGGSGTDSMLGGDGNDIYVVSAGDVLSDSGGTDTAHTQASFSLSASSGVENLTMLGTTGGTTLGGNQLNNILTGSDANNASINGRAGNDTMFGMGGNDTFDMSTGGTSTYGDDVMDGGAGVDTIDFGANARSALIVNLATRSIAGGGDAGVGTVAISNVENVVAGAFRDRLTGDAAANYLYGGAADDTVDGGAGNDRLEGGTGFDQYVFSVAPGAANADTIVGFVGGSSEKIVLTTGAHANLGAAGNFTATDARFNAGAGFNSARDSTDRVVYNSTTGQLWYDADGLGGAGAQLIATLQGAPTLRAADIVVQSSGPSGGGATAGNDSLTGTAGNDTIDGLAGNDSISGLGGNDSLIGGDGDDTLDGGTGTDTMAGGLGSDTYYVREQSDALSADPGGIDTVITVDINWTLADGFEYVSTQAANSPQNPSSATFLAGNALDNFINGSETALARLEGRGGNDTLWGSGRGFASDLDGGSGNDVLDAGAAADTLGGGAGNDTLLGHGGADQYIFADVGTANADLLTEFTSGQDKIRLDARTMTALGTSGNFTASDERFHAGAVAAETDDRVIYNSATGQLWYDANGSVTGGAQLIATIQSRAPVAATDIVVDNGTQPGMITGTSGNDSLTGTANNDTINGLAGNDTIDGGEGSDSLIGGDGNDVLRAGHTSASGDHGFDTLDGGLGNDEYHVSNIPDTILPDPGGIDTVYAIGDWTLAGGLENLVMESGTGTGNGLDNRITNAVDGGTIFGMGGNDTLSLVNGFNSSAAHGGDGNDTLEAARGSSLNGDAGNDVLRAYWSAGGTTMTGGAGGDSFVLGSFANQITDFASGSDKIRLDAELMTALGTTGNFAAGDERFHTGTAAAEADDRVVYNSGMGQLWYDADGSATGATQQLILTVPAGTLLIDTDIAVDNGTAPPSGGQTITGTAGNDSLSGTSGNDTLDGLGGNDTLNGGLGDDKYIAQAGDVLIDSGGVDTLETPSAWDLFSVPIENITLTGTSAVGILANDLANNIVGNSANNSLQGRGGNDTISGGGGNDYFRMTTGGATTFGADVLNGGDGVDMVDHDGAQSALNVDLAVGTVTGGEAGGGGGLTLTSIESFEGGAFNDRISGTSGNNQLFGNAGNDTLIGLAGGDSLSGGDGNDWVEGGSGFDTLIGGLGNDSFVFTSTSGRVTDFVANTDQLLFENAVFTGLGAPADWAAGDGRFHAAAGATAAAAADDRLIYNQTNGNLYYDSDGVGGAGSQLVTTLANLPGLTAADISVI